jgi:hypothetical protein
MNINAEKVSGKPPEWSRQEEESLLRELASGMSREELSVKHNRSSSAIDLRIKKIVFDNVTDGKTEDRMAKMLNVPQETIKQYYYEYKGFLEKKGKFESAVSNIKSGADGSIVNGNGNGNGNGNTVVEPVGKPAIEPTKLMTSTKLPDQSRKDQVGGAISKLQRIERENVYMKAILENIEMKKQIGKLVKAGVIDKSVGRTLRRAAKGV